MSHVSTDRLRLESLRPNESFGFRLSTPRDKVRLRKLITKIVLDHPERYFTTRVVIDELKVWRVS